MNDFIHITARHRWHALAAVAIVLTTHGWLLSSYAGTAPLLGSAAMYPLITDSAPSLAPACEPRLQYARIGQEVTVTAINTAPQRSYEWDAPDADIVDQTIHTLTVRYLDRTASTHAVAIIRGNQFDQCLVIIR